MPGPPPLPRTTCSFAARFFSTTHRQVGAGAGQATRQAAPYFLLARCGYCQNGMLLCASGLLPGHLAGAGAAIGHALRKREGITRGRASRSEPYPPARPGRRTDSHSPCPENYGVGRSEGAFPGVPSFMWGRRRRARPLPQGSGPEEGRISTHLARERPSWSQRSLRSETITRRPGPEEGRVSRLRGMGAAKARPEGRDALHPQERSLSDMNAV